jgi:hypothetical protein
MLTAQLEASILTPDEFYSVLQLVIIVVVFATILLLFAHIAYERTEKT